MLPYTCPLLLRHHLAKAALGPMSRSWSGIGSSNPPFSANFNSLAATRRWAEWWLVRVCESVRVLPIWKGKHHGCEEEADCKEEAGC
jgi:hypothetical protein